MYIPEEGKIILFMRLKKHTHKQEVKNMTDNRRQQGQEDSGESTGDTSGQ